MALDSRDDYPPLSRWLAKPSALFLVLMNLVPLAGAYWLGWSAGELIMVYWVETIVIGLFNIPKILTSGMDQAGIGWGCGVLFIAVFFIVHYGLFNYGHYTFIRSIFKAAPPDVATVIAAAGLSLSHLFSLIVNWFGKKEYVGVQPNEQMFKPYGRVIIMHVVILIGGAISMGMGSPLYALVMLVALKVTFDLWAHARSHGWVKPIPVQPA